VSIYIICSAIDIGKLIILCTALAAYEINQLTRTARDDQLSIKIIASGDRPVLCASVPDMTYNVFGGTLNPAQSNMYIFYSDPNNQHRTAEVESVEIVSGTPCTAFCSVSND